MFDIVVYGSIAQDLVSYTDQFPRPGETIKGTFATSPGGKGANQAAQAAMLGATVCMIGRVGKDVFGASNVDNLRSFGVNTEYIDVSDSGKTGAATIIVTKDGENSIVISPGANMECLSSRIDELEQVVASAKLILCQNETVHESVKRIFELARKHNVQTFLNYAPVEVTFAKSILKLADILCANEIEAEYLADQHIETTEDAKKAVRKLLEGGPLIVILTLGAKGVTYASKQGDSGHIMVPAVKVIETTGAGDSFCGALAYFLVKRPELELKEQIRRAAYIATLSVQRKGTRDSYLWPKDLPPNLLM
uniref:Ribokinase n=1 Tax=Elaeophora elaphi TaxID=1147741 RepID=A0A0R3RRU0_9BILA